MKEGKFGLIGEPRYKRGPYQKRQESDRRELPRINNYPIDDERHIIEVLKKAGIPLTEKEIIKRIIQLKTL